MSDFDFEMTRGLHAQRSGELLRRIEQSLAWEELRRDLNGDEDEQRSDCDREDDVYGAIEAVALIRSLSDNPHVPWRQVSLIMGWVLEAIIVPWSPDLLEHILDEIAAADAKHKDEEWDDAWWAHADDVAAELEGGHPVILG